MEKEKLKSLIYIILPILGTVFVCWYITQSTCDVVYSDYIRLVNSYLPDVYDLKKFLVPDVLTRIPINYLERIINVEFFGFSVTLDRMLGAVGLGLAGLVFAAYCKRRRLGLMWFVILMAVMFSLNKWEMITNGSGWAHFLAFAGFYYHELVLDRVWSGQGKKGDKARLCILPWLIILGAAGPYGASYAAILLVSYLYCMIRSGQKGEKEDQRWFVVWFFCALIPLLLYILSNSYVIEEHAGDTGRPLWVILSDNPTFPIRFLLKSFAGILVGGEELTNWMNSGLLSNKACYGIGLFVICGYLAALWMNIRYRLYERAIMPMLLLLGGGLNHLLVFLTRYIFEKESYALNSSRYTLQFQVGIFGILLTFALVLQIEQKFWMVGRTLAAIFSVAILLGNGYTTYHELEMAPYRKEWFEARAERALEVPELTDEEFEAQGDELADFFEYWNGNDKIRNAYRILEENHWNVFREEE